jgi:energy-coupling factor transport system permease protein
MNAKPKIAYQARDSWLHQLHPLVKLSWLVGFSVSLFVISSPVWVLVVLLLAVVSFPLVGLSLRNDVRGMRFLIVTGLALFLVQILFNHTGSTVLHLPLGPVSLSVTDVAITNGVYVGGRFLALIFLSYLFVLTTEPSALAYALMQVGLPYRYGFVFITALRLAPIFEVEANTVYQAQLTRGVQYDVRSLRKFVTLARQLILPLLVSALSKVDDLAVSMEGRCFGKYATRTYRRVPRYTTRDLLALSLFLVGVLAMVWSTLPRLL